MPECEFKTILLHKNIWFHIDQNLDRQWLGSHWLGYTLTRTHRAVSKKRWIYVDTSKALNQVLSGVKLLNHPQNKITIKKRKRTFQESCLKQFLWLSYDLGSTSMFCQPGRAKSCRSSVSILFLVNRFIYWCCIYFCLFDIKYVWTKVVLWRFIPFHERNKYVQTWHY